MGLEAVIFDKGNTLLKTEEIALRARQQTINGFYGRGEDYTFSLHQELLGVPAQPMFNRIRNMVPSSVDFEMFIEAYRETYMKMYEDEGIETMEGAVPLLLKLKTAGLRLAIATGASKPSTDYTLKRAGIYEYFDAIATSDQVERGKPHPDIFLKAAADLGTHPLRCAAVGDGVNDILGAKRAGMMAILYEVYPDIPTVFPEGAPERPDHTVTRLSDVSRILLPSNP